MTLDPQKLAESLKVKKSDFITVVKWRNSEDESYVGDCLEVLVVDENLLRVKVHCGFKPVRTLNLDEVEIRPLSKEFVDCVLKHCASKASD
ncbi:hypothetical protein [Neptuniibacter sp. QD37_11]|uniref:hypothetical protein n=1 Tax=Neptuniibacter sp. QD37_11 TaxID=3398209 RepID=UPI0039F4BABB